MHIFIVSARGVRARWVTTLLGAAWLSFVAGCGGSSYATHEVDVPLAKQTLRDVLQSWQDGAAIESWRTREPEVVVQEMEWLGGTGLKEFEVLQEQAVDANLHCKVRLVLDVPKKGQKEQTVTYLVSTSPAITVFRQMGP